MQNKNQLISFLQAFGIILVVLGHSFQTYPSSPFIKQWIYGFHMPLFMFISGYLFKYSSIKNNVSIHNLPIIGKNGLAWKKCKRLLLPYVIISSLAFLPKSILSQFADRPVNFSFEAWVQMLIYPWNNVIILFWFLPTLYLIFIIVTYTCKFFSFIRNDLFLNLFILCLFFVFHITKLGSQISLFNFSGVFVYLMYFWTGFLYCQYQNTINKILHLKQKSFMFTAYIISIIFTIIKDCIPNFIIAYTGIYFSISLGYLYCEKQYKFLDHLSTASYIIYLFSWFPQSATQQIISHYWELSKIINTILAFISGLYVPYSIFKLWNKCKYFK